jgi:predicted anti-sigma-YlaC factor YlaD
MTCKRASAWLQLYVDGRLDMRRLVRLEEHLDACQACREDLDVLEAICHGAATLDTAYEPADLTAHVMRRVADLEARRLAAGRRGFGLGWADALLAGLLATVMTALFLWFQPALSQEASAAVMRSVLTADRGIAEMLSTWSAWVVWAVWVGAGLALAIWFAGSEVRAGWRRTLAERLPR